jgi:hypothetical protein
LEAGLGSSLQLVLKLYGIHMSGGLGEQETSAWELSIAD